MAVLSGVSTLAGAYLSNKAAGDQADAMRGATREQMELQREQFDYARDLQEQLLQQQAPAREASSRATRSLSMLAGLGDPGSVERQRRESRLQNLKDQLTETDKYFTTGGEILPVVGRETGGAGPDRYRGKPFERMTREEKLARTGEPGRGVEQLGTVFQPESTKINPEFQRLENEISTLEQELGGEMPGDQFDGPMEVTDMPGYQFALDQGQEALSASGAARGMQLSGNQMQDITKFGQGTAMQFRGQLIDQLAQVAGMRPSGQTATNLGNLAIGQGQAMSGLAGQMGQIGAAETAGKAGAMGNVLANLDQFFPQQQPTNTVGSRIPAFSDVQDFSSTSLGGGSGRTF